MKLLKTTTIDKLDQLTINRLLKNVEFKKTWIGQKLVWAALVPCGFDIEATRQYMYLWTCSVKYLTVVGYTWEEYKKLLSMFKEALDLGIKTKVIKHRNGEAEDKNSAPYTLPIFIHNLKYEYSFMKNEFSFENVFFIDKGKRNPLYLFDGYFVYVDSYKIYPKKLEDVAKAYCATQKTHDLDYSIERNTDDAKKLSQLELEYCIKDTRILVELAEFTFNKYFIPYGRLPLTQNQIIKLVIKDFHDRLPKEEKEAVDKWLRSQTLTQDQYLFIRDEGFRGGYCASSQREIKGDVLYGDETSAYCSAIVHGHYPVSAYRTPKFEIKTEDDINYFLGKKCFQAKIKFFNLRSKGDKLVKYESRSNVTWCLPDGSYPKTKEDFDIARKSIRTTVSGKIWKAACIEASLTDIDWEIYNKVYEWDRIEVKRFEVATIGELPDYIKQVAFALYGTKASLKKAGIKGPEYQSAKTLVSNVFGCMVQQLSKELVEGDEDTWLAKMLGSLIKPQWGVYVSANARKVLIDTILELGVDTWAYSDTDSFYADKTTKALEIVEKYNNTQKCKNIQVCERYGLKKSVYDDLGCWDDDNKDIIHFKTLGSKCYLYMTTDEEDPFKLVMSGVPEQYFWDAYDKTHKKRTEKDVFKFFEKDTEIEYIRKRIVWVDEPTTEVINGMTMTSKSGCIIKDEKIVGPLCKVSELIAAEHVIESMDTDVI